MNFNDQMPPELEDDHALSGTCHLEHPGNGAYNPSSNERGHSLVAMPSTLMTNLTTTPLSLVS